MRPHSSIDQDKKDRLAKLLAGTGKASDFRRIQCVWLRVQFGMDSITVAGITNLQPGTVRKIWSDYLRYGEKSLFCKERGGRKRFNMTIEEEKSLLTPFLQRVGSDSIIIVAEIQAAYEMAVHKKVPKSTIYRLLKRHHFKYLATSSTQTRSGDDVTITPTIP